MKNTMKKILGVSALALAFALPAAAGSASVTEVGAWPNFYHSVDSITAYPGYIRINGWMFDNNDKTTIQLTFGDKWVGLFYRDDVTRAYSLPSGLNTGFDVYLPLKSGTYSGESIICHAWHGTTPYRIFYINATIDKPTATFDRQGGTGGTGSTKVDYGTANPAITPPTKAGFAFEGYYTGANGTGTKYYNCDGTSAKNWAETGGKTLYANWIDPTTVSNWAQLKAALIAGTHATVTADIDFDGTQAYLNAGQVATLDLNGHVIRRVNANQRPLAVGTGSKLTIVGPGVFDGKNYTTSWGGGFFDSEGNNSTLTISGAVQIVNFKSSNNGGAIWNNAGSAVTICDGVVISNCTSSSNGGAVYNASGASFAMTGGAIVGCTATSYGGALYSQGAVALTNGVMTLNRAADGSAFSVGTGAQADVFDCTITNNASTAGGAVHLNAGSGNGLRIYGAVIANNTKGAAIADFNLEKDGAATVYGGVFGVDPSGVTNLAIADGYAVTPLGDRYLVGKDVVLDADDRLTKGLYTFDPRKAAYAAAGVSVADAHLVAALDMAPPQYEVTDHIHCVCGDGACAAAGHVHETVGWAKWTATDSLPSTAGCWYLANDVTLTAAHAIAADVNLCLNGHKVNTTVAGVNMISVASGCKFVLTDCQGNAGRITTDGLDCGVNQAPVNNAGTFAFYGGMITNCVTRDNSGGLRNTGTAYMYGGIIADCYDRKNGGYARGGGVCNIGTFHLVGGLITRCRSERWGGGVMNFGGTMYMSGGEIRDNTGDGIYCGTLYLTGGIVTGNTGYGLTARNADGWSCSVTVGGDVQITGNTNANMYLWGTVAKVSSATPFTADAQIGVTTQTAPAGTTKVAVTGTNTGDCSRYFTSDIGCAVINESNVVKLMLAGQYPFDVYRDGVLVNGCSTLSAAIAVVAAGAAGDWTIRANKDYTSTEGCMSVAVGPSKPITIDTNGKTIKAKAYQRFFVISNRSKVTLAGSGTFQGNGTVNNTTDYCWAAGGFAVVGNQGSPADRLVLDGPTLKDFRAKNHGGAICLTQGSAFEMKSGLITGCVSGSMGGGAIGIEGQAGNAFTMTGGTICGNTANDAGGYGGGAVCCHSYVCRMNLLGGVISNNVSSTTGAGVNGNATITVGGDFRCVDNVNASTKGNLYLPSGITLAVTNAPALAAGAQIGVFTATKPTTAARLVPVTSDRGEDLATFTSDEGHLVVSEAGKVQLKFVLKVAFHANHADVTRDGAAFSSTNAVLDYGVLDGIPTLVCGDLVFAGWTKTVGGTTPDYRTVEEVSTLSTVSGSSHTLYGVWADKLVLGAFAPLTQTFPDAEATDDMTYKRVTLQFTRAVTGETFVLPTGPEYSNYTKNTPLSTDDSCVIDLTTAQTAAEIATNYLRQVKFRGCANQELRVVFGPEGGAAVTSYARGYAIAVADIVAPQIAFNAWGGYHGDDPVCEVTSNACADGVYAFPRFDPTRAGAYAFDGWYQSWTNGAAQVVEGAVMSVQGPHTVYAKWISKSTPAGEGTIDYEPVATNADGSVVVGAGAVLKGATNELENTDLAIPEFTKNGADGVPYVIVREKAFAYQNYDKKLPVAKRLTSVTVSTYVTNIKTHAFMDCLALTNVTFSKTRDYTTGAVAPLVIEDYAFKNATVSSLYFPAGSRVILREGAFGFADKLKDVYFGGEVEVTGSYPFIGAGRRSVDAAGNRVPVAVHLAAKLAADPAFVLALTNGMTAARVVLDNEHILGEIAVDPSKISVTLPTVTLTFKVPADSAWQTVSTDTLYGFYATTPAGILVGSGKVLKPTTLSEKDASGEYTATFTLPSDARTESGFFKFCIGDPR